MKICPNRACPYRWEMHRPAEYRDEVARCVDCGTLLIAADERTVKQLYVVPSYRKQWTRLQAQLQKALKQRSIIGQIKKQSQTRKKIFLAIALLAMLGATFWALSAAQNEILEFLNIEKSNSDLSKRFTSELSAHRTIWLSQEIDSYRYAFTWECALCSPMTPVIVEVRKGVVVSVADKNGSEVNDQGQPYKDHYQQLLTVDKLFKEADDLIQLPKKVATAIISIEYDQQYGFPAKLCTDDTRFGDFYGCTVISEFEVLK